MRENIIAMISIIGLASSTASTIAEEVIPLTPACETALALSGGPKNLREGAGVYILGADGFEMVKEKTNKFVCLVVRGAGVGMAPQCFDEYAQQAHVKVFLDEGKKLRQGVTFEQMSKDRTKGFLSGKYKAPAGPGLVYMASDYNYRQLPDGRKIVIAPHVMYHAPNLTAEDIGSDQESVSENYGIPFINSVGPLGFMIAYVERATDSTDVISACTGQLPDRENFMLVPPKR